MKNLTLTKVISSTLVIASVLALNPIGASAEWRHTPSGSWYKEGSSWATGWRLIDSKWYYFDSEGYMAKDTTIDGYYLSDSGALLELTTSGNFKFDKSTGTIVEYIGSDSSVVIPSKIDDIEVKRIKFTSASSCKSLTSLIVLDSTKSIESIVCMNCSNLTSIVIPNSVKNIDTKAFAGCSSLTSIDIPNSVASMGNDVFQDCINLTSITIPDSVKNIGCGVFTNCSSLTNITLPNSITIINEFEFQGCTNLTSITIPNGVTSIQRDAFAGCTSLTSITIPDSVTSIVNYQNSPRGIGINPFHDCINATIYVKSETVKQLLVKSGVSASKVIVSA